MAKGISGIEIEQKFNSTEEAEAWGRENFDGDYSYAFVDVQGKTYLLCATGMCDDVMLRGKIEQAVIDFFEDLGLQISDEIYVDIGADANEVAWEYLSKYKDFDVLYAFDEY